MHLWLFGPEVIHGQLPDCQHGVVGWRLPTRPPVSCLCVCVTVLHRHRDYRSKWWEPAECSPWCVWRVCLRLWEGKVAGSQPPWSSLCSALGWGKHVQAAGPSVAWQVPKVPKEAAVPEDLQRQLMTPELTEEVIETTSPQKKTKPCKQQETQPKNSQTQK
jgi:hypothetical protein